MDTSKDQQSESSLMYFLRLVIKNWKLLFYTYLTVGIITVIILLLLPRWYKSEATIVILEENTSSLSSMLSDFSSFGLNLGGGAEVETYIQYANTKKMYERLDEKFNLMEAYEVKYRENLYDAIFENLTIADNENRTFTVSYQYKEDPQKARDIVQYIYEVLNDITLEVDKAQASNFRSYIEKYYQDVKKDLKADEDSLIKFQNQTGILSLQQQLEVTIEGMAELETQKIKLEIEKEYLESSFKSSPKISEIEFQLSAIQTKIDELKKQHSSTFVSLETIPSQGADFLRLKRDIMIGEKVAEFLRLQYEQALLDEQKINSNLYLVDPPKVPEKKFKPQRSKLLFLVMLFTVFASLIFIRVKEFYQNNSDSIMKLVTKTK